MVQPGDLRQPPPPPVDQPSQWPVSPDAQMLLPFAPAECKRLCRTLRSDRTPAAVPTQPPPPPILPRPDARALPHQLSIARSEADSAPSAVAKQQSDRGPLCPWPP